MAARVTESLFPLGIEYGQNDLISNPQTDGLSEVYEGFVISTTPESRKVKVKQRITVKVAKNRNWRNGDEKKNNQSTQRTLLKELKGYEKLVNQLTKEGVKVSDIWQCIREPLGRNNDQSALLFTFYDHCLQSLLKLPDPGPNQHISASKQESEQGIMLAYLQLNFKNLMLAILTPLNYLHRAGMLHCDIKPANYLFNSLLLPDSSPHIVLSDLGSWRRANNPKDEKYGTTAQYRAPILWAHPTQASHATDLYSVAVLLVEIGLGRSCLHYANGNPPIHAAFRSGTPRAAKVQATAAHVSDHTISDTELQELIEQYKYIPFDKFECKYSSVLTNFLKRMAGDKRSTLNTPVTTEAALQWIQQQNHDVFQSRSAATPTQHASNTRS